MVMMSGLYQGEKHCEITHGPSKALVETDAPKDNNGKGESFSPTDLVGAALGSCMLTVMAIQAEKEGLSIKGASFQVEKVMSAAPRKIQSLAIKLKMPAGIPAEKRAWLTQIAETCPVKLSLHSEIQAPITIEWQS